VFLCPQCMCKNGYIVWGRARARVCVCLLCTVLSGLPLPPTNLSVSELTSVSVTLTWTSASTGRVQSYIIQYRRKYSPDQYTDIVDLPITKYTVSPLRANTVYEFRIVAVNHFGWSQPSVTVNVTTLAEPGTRINFRSRIYYSRSINLARNLLERCNYFAFFGTLPVLYLSYF